jgi:hypothetical protein
MADTDPKVPPVVPPVDTTPKEKMVEVPETVLTDILKRLDQRDEEIAALKEAQKEFEQTASQDQILKIEKLRASGKLVKSVRINFYENKMVTSWRSTADDVFIDTNGKEISVQKTELTFGDGKTQEVPQIDFARRKLQRSYEVIKEGRDRDGNMKYTVLMEGGKEVEVDGRYIN